MTRGLREAYGKNEWNGLYKYFFRMDGRGKRLVCPFIRKEFRKRIGCVLSAVTYGKKVHKLWSEIPKSFGRTASTKLGRDVCINIDLNTVCCYHYCHIYIYAWHWIILSYTTSFISWMFLWLLTTIYSYRFMVYPWKRLRSSVYFGHVPLFVRR